VGQRWKVANVLVFVDGGKPLKGEVEDGSCIKYVLWGGLFK
jgi:hypothetical protein